MSSILGNTLKVSVFGESHGAAIGVVIDGLPAGEAVDLEALQAFLNRRAPGRNDLSTQRSEADVPRILSGLPDGITCGTPLCAVIENGDTRSKDYGALYDTPRPSHADYAAHMRYRGHQDMRGGGHFSGRLTVPLCVAGGIALQLLERRKVTLGAHIERIGSAADCRFEPVHLTPEEIRAPSRRAFPVLDEAAGEAMMQEIRSASADGDSVGGVIECAAVGLPAGIGDPMFDGLENRLSAAVFGIPAVRGIEFGSGFAATQMRGSLHNDPYEIRDGAIVTRSNHHGGILGGITTGMPLIFRAAFKPTPSIAKQQRTVNIRTAEETDLEITGRHDPCIVPRAVPCIEAVTALVLLEFMLRGENN